MLTPETCLQWLACVESAPDIRLSMSPAVSHLIFFKMGGSLGNIITCIWLIRKLEP